MSEHIVDFMPRLLEHSSSELFRSKIGDVITLVEGFNALWEVDVISTEQYSKVHVHCQSYLCEFMAKSKRTINGRQFADLMMYIGEGKHHGIFPYTEETITRLEKDFVSYQAENSHFTVSDLLNLMVAFDRVSTVNIMPTIVQTVVDILPRSIKNSDQAVLALFNKFDKMGLLQLEKFEHLCHFV